MALLTVAELRAAVDTDKTDSDLRNLIDREEADLIRRFGPHYDGTAITETHEGGGGSVYLRRPISSISSVTEYASMGDSAVVLETTGYHAWTGQGRLSRLVSSKWGGVVVVSYIPEDDSDVRKRVIIELCRLALARTGLKSESIAGEYSYTAHDNWDVQRASIYRQLGFMEV